MPIIANPYIAGNPLTRREMFFGREDIFQFIRDTLIGQHQDNVIVLHGQQRTGKTSILYQLHHHMDERYICVLVDLHSFAFDDLGTLLYGIAIRIANTLNTSHQLDIPIPNRDVFRIDHINYFENIFLLQVQSSIEEHHILLMIDEATRLLDKVQSHTQTDVFTYMRSLIQRYECLNFLFSVSSNLEELTKDYSFLFNVGLCKKISFFDRQTTYMLISQPVEECYQIEPGAQERIYQITSGHPYYTQQLCHRLFNLWKRQPIACIRIQHVDEILDDVVELGTSVSQFVWDRSTAGEKVVMLGIVTMTDSITHYVTADAISTVWKYRNVFIPEGEMERAIDNLIKRDVIIAKTHDVITDKSEYTFTVELQRLWIQKYKRLEGVKASEIEDAVHIWLSSVPTEQFEGTISLPLLSAGAFTAPTDSIKTFPYRSSETYMSKPISSERLNEAVLDEAVENKSPYEVTIDGSIVPFTPLPLPIKDRFGLWTQSISRRTVIIGLAGGLGLGILGVTWQLRQLHPKTIMYRPGDTLFTYRGHSQEIYAVAWSHDGKRIASASQDKTVHVWDAVTGNNFLSYQGHIDTVQAVTWSSDDLFIASGSADKTVQVWDSATRHLLTNYKRHTNTVNSVAWSPDGRFIASASSDKTVQVWDNSSPSGHTYTVYKKHSDIVYVAAWSPNNTLIASGGADGTIEVWEAMSNLRFFAYQGHPVFVDAIAWSPDGRFIVSGGGEKIVRIWDTNTAKQVLTCEGHKSVIYSVAWSPDGKFIASASKDKTVRVWLAKTGKPTLIYDRHTEEVYDLAWSPNSKLIASASKDKTVRVWLAVS